MCRAGVFLLGEKADVLLDPRHASLDAVLAAVEGAGFSAELLSSTGAHMHRAMSLCSVPAAAADT